MSIGVGLIGTGYMGKCHALAWNAVAPTFGDVERPRLELLCDNVDATARAQALGFARATPDWRDVVTDPRVDVVSITTPNHLHAEIAIAALQAGKHVWCEKPMATSFADAGRMREAARASGRVAVLGYNYVQNPVLRLMRRLVAEGAIGTLTHLRLEMDEDFMADAGAPFSLRSEARSGYGAADDFMVHQLSLIWTLAGPVARVLGDMAKPYADRPHDVGRRAVETFDVASALLRLANGASGVMVANRAAWGRKGRIAIQLYGSTGSLVYDQERMNEVELFTADGDGATRGFRRVLAGPAHPPYGKFVPAPGHSLGFNDLKVIECRQLLGRLRGEADTLLVDFDTGLAIERCVHAIAESHERGAWIDL